MIWWSLWVTQLRWKSEFKAWPHLEYKISRLVILVVHSRQGDSRSRRNTLNVVLHFWQLYLWLKPLSVTWFSLLSYQRTWLFSLSLVPDVFAKIISLSKYSSSLLPKHKNIQPCWLFTSSSTLGRPYMLKASILILYFIIFLQCSHRKDENWYESFTYLSRNFPGYSCHSIVGLFRTCQV